MPYHRRFVGRRGLGSVRTGSMTRPSLAQNSTWPETLRPIAFAGEAGVEHQGVGELDRHAHVGDGNKGLPASKRGRSAMLGACDAQLP
jgi:hypothetical protein